MDTLAPLAVLSRTLACLEHTFYPEGVHHQHPDRTITAHLTGAASRLAGWQPPTGEARAAAVAELRAAATIRPKRQPRMLHEPAPQLRTDLLAEAAGLLYGTAPADRPEAHHAAAELLVEAGADPGLLDHWVGVGKARAAASDGALMDVVTPHQWP